MSSLEYARCGGSAGPWRDKQVRCMAPVSLGGVFWESMTSGVITEQVLAWMASHQALT